MCAWLAPPVLSPQAIYNVFRNVRNDLTSTSYTPGAPDGTGDILWRNIDVADLELQSDSEPCKQKCLKNTLT